MSNITTTTTTPPEPSHDLAAQLIAAGYRPGLPARISEEVYLLDKHTYSRGRCHHCRRRGQRVRAMTNGRLYRLVCTCRGCGSQTEA